MTQLNDLAIRILLVCVAFGVGFGFPNQCTQAATPPTEIDVVCNDQECYGNPVSTSQTWAPGTVWQGKVQIQNQSPTNRTLAGYIVIGQHKELASATTISWRNGSHRLLWQGTLAQATNQVVLGHVPARSSRIFWLEVGLPKMAGNEFAQAAISFEPFITVTGSVAAAMSGASTATKNSSKTSTSSNVLGQMASRLSFTLPDLHQLTAGPGAEGASTVVQIVRSARNQSEWIPLVLLLEIAALWLWHHQQRSWVWLGGIGFASIAVGWTVVGWWLASIAMVLVGVAICWRFRPTVLKEA